MSQVKLKNFAKIKDSSLDIQDITVIAGKPGTGKSYIMKFLYAINEFYFKKSQGKLLENFIEDEKIVLYSLSPMLKKDKAQEARKFLDKNDFESYEGLIKNEVSFDFIDKQIESIKRLYTLSDIKKDELFISNILKSIFSDYHQISSDFDVKYESLNIRLENDDIKLSLDSFDLKKSNETIFVETPLILEFKKFMNKQRNKTPYHIESLLNILDTDYSFVDEEEDKFIKEFTLKSKAIIEGKIENKSDSFIFSRNDNKNFDIINASSGIKSIGLLQYLVLNKALKKGSILFWEEPEVHLHPNWQIKMVELFIELMNNGVKIVFSTHSPYMCDYLNAISQKNDLRNRISFNLLNEENSIVTNTVLDKSNWNLLQSELLDPLEEIMWEYI